MTKLSSDTTKINGIALSMIGITVQTVFCLFFGMALGFYYEWRSALIMIGFIPLIILNSALDYKMQQGYMDGDEKIEVEAGSILSESVINTKTIFSYNMERKVVDMYSKIIRGKNTSLLKSSMLIGIVFGFSQFILFGVFATLNFAGAHFYYNGWITDIMDMNKSIFAILMAAYGMGQAQQYVGNYSKAKEALVGIYSVLNEQSLIDPLDDSKDKLVPKSIEGKIEFVKVTFSYPSRPKQIVFKDLSFTILPGTSNAFVGFSGSGKSTIIQLLERFYDPINGSILIDGVDIKEYNLASLRRHIGLVLQEPVLFKRDVKENIRYGNLNASEEEILSSAKTAYIEKFLEDGKNRDCPVSGGEKQRIAIARAVLKNPRILLLDEATSALDKNSEEIVQKALDNLMVDKTCIVVAHRLSTIVNSDVIFVLDNGKIVECGKHQELLNNKGPYYNLYIGSR